ncbi:unnamed protein product, partial [Prorocentrum cordatum]
PQLTAAVWCWDKQNENGEGVKDPNRYWDDGAGGGPWMYWESFWAPTEPGAVALQGPAFGDAAGAMLAPLMDPSGTAAPARPLGADEAYAAAMMNQPEAPQAVGSTAIGQATGPTRWCTSSTCGAATCRARGRAPTSGAPRRGWPSPRWRPWSTPSASGPSSTARARAFVAARRTSCGGTPRSPTRASTSSPR